jgi:hypothetical protein
MIRGEAIQGKKNTRYEKTTKPNFLFLSTAETANDIMTENKPNQKTNGLPKA